MITFFETSILLISQEIIQNAVEAIHVVEIYASNLRSSFTCYCLFNPCTLINNPTTGDKSNIIADLKTVLKELHNQTKQILMSAVSTVDSNGTLTQPNFIKYVYQLLIWRFHPRLLSFQRYRMVNTGMLTLKIMDRLHFQELNGVHSFE